MLENVKSYFTSKFFASGIDVFLLGMTISVCGNCFAWRFAMQTHYYEYLTDIIIVTVMYICLVLCVAEMMSALPFSGGIYGLARVALSPYMGFLVGILEVFKNIFHISCCVQPLAKYVATILHDTSDDQQLYWFVILGSVAVFSVIGGRFFWNFNRILGLACLAFTIMYLCTPIMNKSDFKLYANTNYFFQPVHNYEIHNMFRFSPLAVWFYIGIELIPFTCIDVKNPTKVVPYTMIAILAVLMVFTFGVYTAACSQFPGALRLYYFNLPLMFGYADMLGMTYENACWFSIICIYASVFAFMFGCGRQISSLSSSGLLPAFLKWKTIYSETPYMSIITTAILCYLTMISVKYGMKDNVNTIYYICILGAFFSYFSVFVTYIQFKRKYVTLKREFTNPFGIYTAILGIVITLILAACLLGLANNDQFVPAPITVAVVLVVGSIYYFSFASKKQYYSEEEQKAFLITYVINSNDRGRKKKRKGGAVGGNDKSSSLFNSVLSYVSLTQPSERSLTSSARKYLSKLSGNSIHSRSKSQNNINNPEEGSVISKDVESNVGSVVLTKVNHQINKEHEEKKNNEEVVMIDSKPEHPHKPHNEHATHKNSIDFTHLPSIETLKHIHDEIEIQEHPEIAQSIKNKEQEMDFLPHTSGFYSTKIIPIDKDDDEPDIEAHHHK